MHRRLHQRRIHHIGQDHVDAVDGCAVYDIRQLQLGRRSLAKEGPLLLRLRRGLLVQHDRGRLRRHFAVAQLAPGRPVRQHALRRIDLGDGHIPFLCGRRLQALTRTGADLQHGLGPGRRGRASGEISQIAGGGRIDILLDIVAVGRGELGARLGPIILQFFRQGHRVLRHDAIADVGRRNPHGNGIVRGYRNPGVEFGHPLDNRLSPGLCIDEGRRRGPRQTQAQSHPSGKRGSGNDELPTIHFRLMIHGALLRSAAFQRPCELQPARADRFRSGRCCSHRRRCLRRSAEASP